jgi:hypothetical protein
MCLVSCLCVPDRNVLPPPSALVLFGASRFHPVHDLAVKLFLNGDVRHGCGWRGTVPMFLEPARTRSRPLVECPRWDHPSVGPGHSQPSRSASGEAWWLCHASRAPGPTVILTPTARAGAGASNRGSRRIAPVKYADGPFPEGCEPLLVMSMCCIPPPCLQKQRGIFSVWW